MSDKDKLDAIVVTVEELIHKHSQKELLAQRELTHPSKQKRENASRAMEYHKHMQDIYGGLLDDIKDIIAA